jgi:AcrR family transcriptional regulator
VAARQVTQLQQPRARATRAGLIEAAVALWLERGVDATTVDEICEAAGASKGSFYFHFARKEDILLEVAVATVSESWEDWEQLAAGDSSTTEVARSIVNSMAARAGQAPKALVARIVTEVFGAGDRWAAVQGDRKDTIDVLAVVLERGQQRGEVSTDYNARELSGLMNLLVLAGMLEWAQSSNGGPLEDLLWRRVELLLKGARAS